MKISKKQLANLRPIKKGERRAAKPAKDVKTVRIAFKITESALAKLDKDTAAAGHKTHSSYIREALGLE